MGNVSDKPEVTPILENKELFCFVLDSSDNSNIIRENLDCVRYMPVSKFHNVKSTYFELLRFLELYGSELSIESVSHLKSNTYVYSNNIDRSINDYLNTLIPESIRNIRMELVAH